MSILTPQGKYMMGILQEIKKYPEYKKHLPIITSGSDVFTDYIDYYFITNNNKIGDMLFIQTIIPFPGCLGNPDYMVVILDPNTIIIDYDKKYYDFNPLELSNFQTMDLDIALFYKYLIRSLEYGCLNWGIPFRKYALRVKYDIYISGLSSINCSSNDIFYATCDIYMPTGLRPFSENNIASSYEDISILYIPTIYMSAIGSQLGIYPVDLIDSFNNLLLKRIHLQTKFND
jgi:hypothetical protein